MTKNCINCGAPFNLDLNKCPYCGTSYYDLSFLDFETGKPFAMKIKTEMYGRPCYITQMVRANSNITMEFTSETIDAYTMRGDVITKFTTNRNLTTNVSFEAVCLPGQKELMRIELGE